MKKSIAFISTLFLAAVMLSAQETPAAQLPPAGPELELVSMMYEHKIDRLYRSLFADQMEEEGEIAARLAEEKTAILTRLSQEFARQFTPDELDTIATFYRSSAGRKFLSGYDQLRSGLNKPFREWEEALYEWEFDHEQ